jgi:Kef-type K+ transport system membrane component KefB/Trk K+ transport system NAD-binding subunit
VIVGDTFTEIAVILALAAAFGALGQKLRQPLIIMFLATGIAAGPAGLGVIESHRQIELLAQIGIALLLFIVGLRLDLDLIRTTGPVALATGLGQIVFTSAIGFLLALGCGLAVVPAAYVAVALTFSSTIIIVKLLSDKKEIDSLHGRIAVGFLIVQDIAAILALVGLTTFGAPLEQEGSALAASAAIAAKGVGLLAAVALCMRFLLPPLFRRLADSSELLNVFAIAWAVLLGAASDALGFSQEVGAFLAGVSLASTPYRDAIGARLTGLRDFLLLFFFIDLGARLDWSTVGAELGRSLLFSLFVLIGNPLIVLAIMGVMGYRRRTGFMAGLTVAQISEFSLIVAALGLSLGHIDPETMGLITLVGVATIFASTYMILYSEPLYRLCSGPLRVFEKRHPYREAAAGEGPVSAPVVDVILVGLGNYGSGVAEHLLERGRRLVAVDFDPRVLERWRARGVPVLYGDMGDPELHEQLPLDKAKWVVSTVRAKELNLALLSLLARRRFSGRVALTAASPQEAAAYAAAGAHVVLRPFSDAAEQAADALTHAMGVFPAEIDWPIAFREIRLRSGARFAGCRVKEIPLRSSTGAWILAVNRAGNVVYDPGPEFRVYPGDRLVVMGDLGELKRAEELLGQMAAAPAAEPDEFVVDEVPVPGDSGMVGRSLGELKFRQNFAVTVVGIRRGEARILSPGPGERLGPGDRLVVLGERRAVEGLKRARPAAG